MASRAYLLGIVVGLVALSGCGGTSIAPVKGRVTCKGLPVKEAAIVFAPVPRDEKDIEPGKSATAQSDADGNYRLSTYKPYDGALVGKHRVTISLDATNPAAKHGKLSTQIVLEVKPGDNDIELPVELKK